MKINYSLYFRQIFDNFKQDCPAIFKKVVPIAADMAEPDLGLSYDDKNLLMKEVSIIFHSAAILKMDASLKTAITINTEAVIYLVNMALKMENLTVNEEISVEFCIVILQQPAAKTVQVHTMVGAIIKRRFRCQTTHYTVSGTRVVDTGRGGEELVSRSNRTL